LEASLKFDLGLGMARRVGKFFRNSGFKEQIPLVLIATEGKETEPQYFDVFKQRNKNIHIKVLGSRKKSSPIEVRKRMEKEIKANEIGEHDMAWLVLDVDQWGNKHLEAAYQWSTSKPNYGLAVSNPMFEYWLLLHFEDGNDINGKRDCIKRLKNYLPYYEKSRLPLEKFTHDKIQDAIKRAQVKDNPPCTKWPTNIGTTLYRMVKYFI
jgi:hypothetical protein